MSKTPEERLAEKKANTPLAFYFDESSPKNLCEYLGVDTLTSRERVEAVQKICTELLKPENQNQLDAVASRGSALESELQAALESFQKDNGRDPNPTEMIALAMSVQKARIKLYAEKRKANKDTNKETVK